MLIVPAIDIRGGQCVRLLRGDYARETVYGDDPAAMALRWVEEGASTLHLVDLDGARSGRSDNERAVRGVLAALGARSGTRTTTELGGGIRDVEAVARWLGAGLDRVILGTVAVTEPDIVSRAAERFPGRVWVGIDARDGKVAVAGWETGTETSAADLARDAERRGAAGVIYTDIERDGTRTGVNVDATVRLADAVGIPVFASGGVGSAADVDALRAAGSKIAGVIVGRALYDGATTLAELLAAARRS
jgi:phosphoribosylformimino-5-aminoimidazole carboxamide ribotide isomerase